MCDIYFTSQISKNCNYILQESILIRNSLKYARPTKNISLVMYLYKNTLFGSNDNITISTEATTILTSPSPFVSTYLFDVSIQAMYFQSKEQFYKHHEELVNIKLETLHLSEDSKVLK